MESSVVEMEAIPPFDLLSTVTQWGVHRPLQHFKDGAYFWASRLISDILVTFALKTIGTLERPRIKVTLHTDEALTNQEEGEALEKVRWILGLNEDIQEFYNLVDDDPILSSVIEDLYGMRVRASESLFYAVSLAIALQNAPIARSRQMLRLLTELLGSEGPSVEELKVYVFPSERAIADARDEDLIRCKWGYRANRLKNSAAVICEKRLTIMKLRKWPMEKVKTVLCGIKGIGEYSAEVVALDALRKYEAFPLDSWSSRILSKIFFKREDISGNRLHGFAEECWGRYRGLAFVYILNDLDNLSERIGVKFV